MDMEWEQADGSFYRGGWSKDSMSGQAFWVTISVRILSRENSLLGDSAIDSDDNHVQGVLNMTAVIMIIIIIMTLMLFMMLVIAQK